MSIAVYSCRELWIFCSVLLGAPAAHAASPSPCPDASVDQTESALSALQSDVIEII